MLGGGNQVEECCAAGNAETGDVGFGAGGLPEAGYLAGLPVEEAGDLAAQQHRLAC
jgi:hypothetical protein